jgi:hypothetical protein
MGGGSRVRRAAVAAAVVAGLVGTGLFAVPATAAETFTVTTTSDIEECADGNADGQLSLREALCGARTAATGTVTVPPGVYVLRKALPVDGNGGAEVRIDVTGAGAAETIIDGNGADRVFTLDESLAGNVHVSLSGLTIRGGTARFDEALGYGGGGAIIGGAPSAPVRDTLALSDCTVSGNTNDTDATRTGSPGGGVQMSGGDLSITNCTFSGNSAGSSSGGGVLFKTDTGAERLTITGSTFTGNRVTNNSGAGPNGASWYGGGALAIDGSAASMTITDTSFVDNTVTGTGAGAHAYGGAVYSQLGSPTFRRTTFTGNTASGTNGANGLGGALYVTGSSGTATVEYSRIVGNTDDDGKSIHQDSGTTVTAARNWWGCNAASCVATTGTVSADPRLLLRLNPASAAVAQGGGTTVTADFLSPSSGPAVSGADLAALRAPTVGWAATLGTLHDQQARVQLDGRATATFVGAAGGGEGSVSATVDGQTVTAAITVSAAPAITTQPANQARTAGQSVTFTAAATGNPTPTVQWEVSANGGTSWTAASGATSPALTFTTAAGDDGKLYRAVFTNSGGTATSVAALLAVGEAPVVTTQPANRTVNAGQSATFTAGASGTPAPAVQWQVSVADGAWTGLAGETGTTLAFAATAGQDGNRYRAVFTNSSGSVASDPATLTVHTAPGVTTQPASQTVNAGQTATFTAAATGSPSPSVQWQVTTDGGTSWSAVAGATSTTLTVTGTVVGQSGNGYRALFTNSVGTTPTAAATLTVQTAPALSAEPEDQVVNAGQTATFTATAGGSPMPTVQWQVSTDGGTSWNPIAGQTATSLSVTTTAGHNGNRYHAVFTNPAGTTTSADATLTVRTAPVVTTDPMDQAVDEGQDAAFTAAATGVPAPAVRWEVSTDDTTWSSVPGATSGTLTVTATAAGQGNRYRAVFTNPAGTATTLPAVLTVHTAPIVTSQPADATVTAGETATFTAAATGRPAPAVQWQVSTGGAWTDLGGETGTTLSFTASQGQDGYRYHAVVTNAMGTVTSGAATLTVHTAPVVTTQPADTTVTAGATAEFTAAAAGAPAPTVQWQVGAAGTWSNVAGATSSRLSFATTAEQDGTSYRAVFTSPAGRAVTTAAALTVRSEPAVVHQPKDQRVRPGQPVTFTVVASGRPAPTVQWQVSRPRAGGRGATPPVRTLAAADTGDWVAIPGATSPTLTFVPTAADDGNRYRALLTNALGTAASEPVALTVAAGPAPSPEPSATPGPGSPSPAAPSTQPGTPPAAQPSGTAKPGPLPVTGRAVATTGGVAVALLLVGAALTVLARRRRRT